MMVGFLSICSAFLVTGITPSPSRAKYFQRLKGKLVGVQVATVETTERTEIRDFTLESDAGKKYNGRIRLPRHSGKFPVSFLVAAFETGRTVVSIVPEYDFLNVVSLDYPITVNPITLSNAISEMSSLRAGGAETIASILLTLDWLQTLPSVDPRDITLIAVSFGVFPAVPAAAADPRISRLVVLQGGGGLSPIVSANASRLGLPLPPPLTGWFASLFLSPFEPNAYIGDIAPRPVLLIASRDDAYFPKSTVESLYQHAREPKELLWLSGEHLGLEKVEMMRYLTRLIVKKLYGR